MATRVESQDLAHSAGPRAGAIEVELASFEQAAGAAVALYGDEMLDAISELEVRLEMIREGHAQREKLEDRLGEATRELSRRASELAEREQLIAEAEMTLGEQRELMASERAEVLAQRRALDARIASSSGSELSIAGSEDRTPELRLAEQQLRERETLLAQRTARIDGEWVRLEAERAAIESERQRSEEQASRYSEEQSKVLALREELTQRERELARQFELFAARQEQWTETSEELRSAVEKARSDAEAAIQSRKVGEQREKELQGEFESLRADRERIEQELASLRTEVQQAKEKMQAQPALQPQPQPQHQTRTSPRPVAPAQPAPLPRPFASNRGPLACLLWLLMVVCGGGAVVVAGLGYGFHLSAGLFGLAVGGGLLAYAAIARRTWEPGVWLAAIFAATTPLWIGAWYTAIETALTQWALPNEILPRMLVPDPVGFFTALTAGLTFVFGVYVVTSSESMLIQMLGATIACSFLAGLHIQSEQVAVAGSALWMALIGASLAHWALAHAPARPSLPKALSNRPQL